MDFGICGAFWNQSPIDTKGWLYTEKSRPNNNHKKISDLGLLQSLHVIEVPFWVDTILITIAHGFLFNLSSNS